MRGDLADAAKAAAGGFDMGIERFGDEPRIDAQIDIADDRFTNPHTIVEAGRGHGRNATRKLRLADVAKVRWALRAKHRLCLDVDRGNEVVPCGHVCHRLVKEVAAPVVLLQVVMCIDDRQVGVDDVFDERPLPGARLGERAMIVAFERRCRCRHVCALEPVHCVRPSGSGRSLPSTSASRKAGPRPRRPLASPGQPVRAAPYSSSEPRAAGSGGFPLGETHTERPCSILAPVHSV